MDKSGWGTEGKSRNWESRKQKWDEGGKADTLKPEN
jgi:hypothetical protein